MYTKKRENKVNVVLAEAKGVRSGSRIPTSGPPCMDAAVPENY